MVRLPRAIRISRVIVRQRLALRTVYDTVKVNKYSNIDLRAGATVDHGSIFLSALSGAVRCFPATGFIVGVMTGSKAAFAGNA
jgi:hypothetical protein